MDNRYAVVHDGVFHWDDVVAIILLDILRPDLRVIRTRDQDVIAKAEFAIDVGCVYDIHSGRFDHHQPNGPTRQNGVPYAAAGLFWKRHGTALLAKLGMTADSDVLNESIIDAVDAEFLMGGDATDNGVVQGHKTLRGNPEVRIPDVSGSLLVSALNPAPGGDFDRAFWGAVETARPLVYAMIRKIATKETSRDRVRDLLYQQPGDILILENFEPSVFDEVVADPEKLYIVYPDEPSGTWRVQQVAIKVGSFEGRLPLPEGWAGKKNEVLDAVTGIDGCIFCHSGRFICGNQTREGAIEMARLARVNVPLYSVRIATAAYEHNFMSLGEFYREIKWMRQQRFVFTPYASGVSVRDKNGEHWGNIVPLYETARVGQLHEWFHRMGITQ